MRGRLPIAVQATADILEAFNCDPIYCPESITLSIKPLELLYGIIISRFVNLTVDLAQKGAVAASMETVGFHAGLPNWIIQVRHATSHGADHPSIETLRGAVSELFRGSILPRYWDAQAALVKSENGANASSATKNVINTHSLEDYFYGGKQQRGFDFHTDNVGFSVFVHWVAAHFGRGAMQNADAGVRFVEFYNSIARVEMRQEIIEESLRYRNNYVISLLLSNSRSHGEAINLLLTQSAVDATSLASICRKVLLQETDIDSDSRGPNRPSWKELQDKISFFGGETFSVQDFRFRPLRSLA